MNKLTPIFVLVLSATLSAQAEHRPEDILTWISDHLQTVSYTVTTPRAAYPENESVKVEFNGCDVKIVEDLKTQGSKIQSAVSFNLSSIQAEMIRFRAEKGYGNTEVTEYFLVQLPLASAATTTTTFTNSGGSKTDTAASTSVSIVFQDRETANRQAHAWRDASLACGAGKPIPVR